MIAVSIANILKQKNNIAIVSHVMPDGDSIGSMIALFDVLKRMGKNVHMYSSDRIPDVYTFLPNSEAIEYCSEYLGENFELTVVLDCGSWDRTGNCENFVKQSSMSINIDHHGTNSLFADLNLVDTNASATGELVYLIIKLMGVDITKEQALCLYTAILTDTGGFRYNNTTSITHQIAGDLINTGIDFLGVYNAIYRNYKYQDIKLMAKAINSIELYGEGSLALMCLMNDSINRDESVNTSDFIDYARDINTVEAAAFIKETALNEFKVSFRSKRIVDVKHICEKYGGGGHTRAAGCTIKGDFATIKDNIISELQMALKDDSK